MSSYSTPAKRRKTSWHKLLKHVPGDVIADGLNLEEVLSDWGDADAFVTINESVRCVAQKEWKSSKKATRLRVLKYRSGHMYN